jgi:hypothetical protein
VRNPAVAFRDRVAGIGVYVFPRLSVAENAVVPDAPRKTPETMIRLPTVTFEPNARARVDPAAATKVPLFWTAVHAIRRRRCPSASGWGSRS